MMNSPNPIVPIGGQLNDAQNTFGHNFLATLYKAMISTDDIVEVWFPDTMSVWK